MKLGDRVIDSINGFSGIVVARAEYMYGCVRLLIEPCDLKADGDIKESQWLDEQRLTTTPTAGPGGPQKDAPRR